MAESLNIFKNTKEFDGKILVVDDDEFILSLISKNLEVYNFEIITSNNGFDALNNLRMQANFDLVLLDIMMPEMSGYEVAHEIRKEYSLFELPILILTAKNHISDMIEGFEAGANDYLAKPFNNDELLARTKTLIRLKKLTLANEALQNAISMKNSFIGMTIHDLRNPLGVIKGVIDLLTKEVQLDKEFTELVDLANTSTELMLNLVDELLEISKLESGKLMLKKSKINLNKAVESSISKFSTLANRKKQKMIFKPATVFNPSINADKIRLQEIIDNLISNAIKFSPQSTDININITQTRYKNGQLNCLLTIKDQGPGFTQGDLKKIFNPFQRLSAQPTGEETSSGLGLSIVKHLVELHDGRIWVESEYGSGSSFMVEFPANN